MTDPRATYLAAGRAFIAEHGRPPMSSEWPNRTMVARTFGTWRAFIHALGFRPFNAQGQLVPTEAIRDAINEWATTNRHEFYRLFTGHTAVHAQQWYRLRNQAMVSDRVADELLTAIGRTDLWHTDPRLWGVGCVPFTGPDHAILSGEAA